MIRIRFAETEIAASDYERYHHPHPRVQRKMEAVFLKSKGLAHNEICRLTGISGNTLRSYLGDYQAGGIEKPEETNFHKPRSELIEHKTTIGAYFGKHPPASIKEAMAKIEELTGIRRSENRVREFPRSVGMKYMKVGMIPAKADSNEQKEFLENELAPRLSEAEEGKRVVFFMDAAHFVLAPFLGYLWCFVKIFIKVPAGRKRSDVLGAMNAITHELIMVCNDEYINAKSVCDLLWLIAKRNFQTPVTIVPDNAKYQKCRIVWELAKAPDIGLLYIPSYSPNLNIIERLWKFAEKKCLWSKYYSDFKEFKNAISDCLTRTHTDYKQELDSLLRLKFQTFEKAQIMEV